MEGMGRREQGRRGEGEEVKIFQIDV